MEEINCTVIRKKGIPVGERNLDSVVADEVGANMLTGLKLTVGNSDEALSRIGDSYESFPWLEMN